MKHLILMALTCWGVLDDLVVFSQKGKDGAKTYSAAGTYILNRYTTLSASAASGATAITVSNITDLSGTTSFTNSVNPYTHAALANGDLVMIIQVQGADMTTTDASGYGAITAYNNTGNFEVKFVNSVAGNTINLCGTLTNSYTESGRARTQVIRIPRLSSLSVSSGVTLTGTAWGGTTGGIVALEVQGAVTLNGIISGAAIGFRGGTDPDISTSSSTGSNLVSYYRTTATTTSAGKGESIVGTVADYASLGGAMGRGAPANGGGGGNGHNGGGGGGSNIGTSGALTPYNGTGIKNVSTASWITAWNLEAASFATDVSVGGGRGGYNFVTSNQNALTLGPGNSAWGGNYRYNVGGFGGHPLDYNTNTRLFMGGGGGAGDGNNDGPGAGGNGGGIIYLLCNGNISGSGSINANGQIGYPTYGSGQDASGGGGGGGAIQVLANGTITGISMYANGGDGGSQTSGLSEAEGPGGGGGGGYIASTTTAITRQVNGGVNGTTNSSALTEFTPEGSTEGNSGSLVIKTFADITSCAVLPVGITSFTANLNKESVLLNWTIPQHGNWNSFEIQRSYNNSDFITIGNLAALSNTHAYSHADKNLLGSEGVVYYRIKHIEHNNNTTYSKTVQVSINAIQNNAVSLFPNPAKDVVQINYYTPTAGKTVIKLLDIKGALVKTITRSSQQGANNFIVDQMEQLKPGTYQVVIQHDNTTISKHLLLMQ